MESYSRIRVGCPVIGCIIHLVGFSCNQFLVTCVPILASLLRLLRSAIKAHAVAVGAGVPRFVNPINKRE